MSGTTSDARYQLLPPLDGNEFSALKADIAERGIQVPIELDEHGMVLDGHHRIRAWQELVGEGVLAGEYPSIIRAGMSEEDKRAHVRSLNLQRRHLSQEQRRGLIREQILDCPTWSDLAVARAIGVKSDTVTSVRMTMPKSEDIPNLEISEDVAIDTLGRRRPRRYRRSIVAKNRREASRAVGALFDVALDDLPEGLLDSRELVGRQKNARRRQHAEAIAAEPPPLPTGPFRVIVADPPWNYGNRVDDPTHRARNPYPDMSIEDICAMPVGDLAADDSVLWLWTTNAHMREAFRVLDAWGFEHKTILTWIKDRMGTGDWLRGQTEHCLLAVSGKPTVLLTNQTTVLHGPLREHSRKPEEFYQLVEALCPGSKVELFSRQDREGWVAHGSEVTA